MKKIDAQVDVTIKPLAELTEADQFDGLLAYRGSAKGAIPNERRVSKINSDKEDANPDGTLGKVFGSIQIPEDDRIGYFVIWDTRPSMPVFVMPHKISEVE